MFAGIMIASRLEPWIGEKAVTIIQLILFCVCAPIIIWMRWQNRKVDKQNKTTKSLSLSICIMLILILGTWGGKID